MLGLSAEVTSPKPALAGDTGAARPQPLPRESPCFGFGVADLQNLFPPNRVRLPREQPAALVCPAGREQGEE